MVVQKFVIGFLLLAGSQLNAQQSDIIAGKVIFEGDPNRTLISKPGWLRGLRFVVDSPDEVVLPRIVALIPDTGTNETVCARITSMSGNYQALVEFVIPSNPAIAVRVLDFDSKIPEVAASIVPDESGIAISRGACEGDRLEQASYIATFPSEVETAMSGQPTGTVPLELNMNIARADLIDAKAVFMPSQGGARVSLETSCSRIDAETTLTFNFRCFVEVPTGALVAPNPAKIEFSYEAIYRGRTSPERSAAIEIGAVR